MDEINTLEPSGNEQRARHIATSPALRLLQYEAEIRRQPTAEALLHHLVHQVSTLVPLSLATVWQRHASSAALELIKVSGISEVDPTSPWGDALRAALAHADASGQLKEPGNLDLPSLAAALEPAMQAPLEAYPLRQLCWLPMPSPDGAVNAGVLCLRQEPFLPGEAHLLARLADTYSHAWRALLPTPARSLLKPAWLNTRRVVWSLAILLGVAMIPVQQSVLAPVEVVARAPSVVTAPFSGVIRNIGPGPSAAVKTGDVLVQFEDVQLRNEAVLAQQKLAVAKARFTRLSAAAFQDDAAKHELALARADHDLALVSRDYAVDLLQRSKITATREGLALYADRRDLEGRAVQVGEEILQIASPGDVQFKARLPVADHIALPEGGEVRVYLERGPLGGYAGRMSSISYVPTLGADGVSAHVVLARLDVGQALPSLGARGTMRLYGPKVPLAVQVLRRAWANARQYLAWW
jgi:hypothetical protein